MGALKQFSDAAVAASPVQLATRDATNDLMSTLDGNEVDFFVYRIADERLESTTHIVEGKVVSFTLSTCTFLTICPGP